MDFDHEEDIHTSPENHKKSGYGHCLNYRT